MDPEIWQASIAAALVAGTPVLLAASGELLAEKVGLFNIGIEGVMLMGALGGFIVMSETGDAGLGLLGAAAAGAGFVLLFAIVTVIFNANQLISGFGLWLLGVGVSTQLGRPYTAQRAVDTIDRWEIPLLADIPFLGEALFQHLWLVYVAFLLPFLIAFVLQRTRHGLNLRAIGEDPASADAVGISVAGWRFFYVLLSGVLVGIGGGFLTLGSVQAWTRLMTSGLGWIGLMVVIFSGWRPLFLILGAYLFGALRTIDFLAQSFGWDVPPEFLSMLPYIGTIAVLLLLAWLYRARPGVSAPPAALGTAFFRGS